MTRATLSQFAVPTSLVLLGGFASGQTHWKEKHGTLLSETFGSVVVRLDDLDGDGINDLAVAAPSYQTAAIGDGRVFVLSGATLGQIWVSTGWTTQGDHGYAVAKAGDVDGDGLSDVLVGAPDLASSGGGHLAPGTTPGRVQLRSGIDGTLRVEVDGLVVGDMFGSSVAGLSDVNGDGVPDFAVGAVGADVNGAGSGSVVYLSGVDGSTLLSVPGPQPGCGFGGAMESMGDLDGDGKRDLIVSAASYDVFDQENAGAVFLLSGATGATLYTWFGPEKDARFGSSLADLGDVNGDGSDDVGIGAVEANGPAGISAGAVYAYSGAGKGQIFVRHGQTESEGLGRSIAGIADVSGDGLRDVLAGSGTSSEMGMFAGQARLFAGTTGAELGRVYGGTAFDYLGWEVADVGDLDGDGVAEIAVSGMSSDATKGELHLYKVGTPMPPSSYCTAKTNSQGCVPELSAQGTPTLSGPDDFVVSVGDAINNKPGLFLWGKKAQLDFVFGSVICVGPPLIRTPPSTTGGTAGPDDCTGTMSFAFTHDYMAQQGIQIGDDVHVQAWYRDPAQSVHPVGLSAGMTFFVVP
jgi:hypothetical protein